MNPSLYIKNHNQDRAESGSSRDEDEFNQVCFYKHLYIDHEMRSDDDELYYSEILYAEEVTAWRLKDSRWLTLTRQEGAHNEELLLYKLAYQMPR